MPETPTARWRIELVGGAGLVGGDGSRLALERKSAALLAVLALDGMRQRAALAALLWPDAPPALARNSLRQRLFKLQRAAGAEIVVGADELRLADGVAVDIADAAQRLARDAHAAAGDLLDGLDYCDNDGLCAWVEQARERWRRLRSERLAELASRHEAQQRVADALPYALRLLADEPLLEHAHRRVMRLHYLRGDRAAALAAYERCKALLRAELGAPPDRETAALAATIGSAAGPMVAAVRAAAPPVSVLRPPRLVGRAAAWARLAAAFSSRRVLLLHGEPGIGKTRLLEDAVQAHAGLLAAGGRAGDARLPYSLLARIAAAGAERHAQALPGWAAAELARLVPALGAAPQARLDPLRLQQAFGAALSVWADAGLCGCVVDDLHHADDASVEALLAQAGAGRDAIAWVFGVRSEEQPPALQAWLDAGADGGVDRVRLERLDAGEVGELLDALALPQFDPRLWRDALAHHSGGNPLFVLETVRALLAAGGAGAAVSPAGARLPVPAALDALIEARLARLSAQALKLARVAALAGVDFDADVAAAVLEAHPLDIVEPWRELEAAQLIAHGRVVHDLIVDAALRALPAGIATSLHARLAGALEALGRGPARAAPHWAAAQSWRRAADAYAAAARDARRASRRSDEVALWEQAADAYDRAGQPGMAFDARADSVESVIVCRGIEAADAWVDRLDADQRTEPQRMRALTSRACVCLMAGRAADGEAAARAALDAAARLAAHRPRFQAARLLAVALAQQGRADESLQTIEPLRDWVTQHGDAEQRHNFWADYAYALKAAQRAGDTAHALRQAMASAQEAGDHAELATLTSNLALVEGNLGRVEQALDHARRARALNDPLGVAVGPPAGAIELYVSVHAGALGQYAESLAGFERAAACFAGSPHSVWSGLTANHLAHVLIHLGQYARARLALQWNGSPSPATKARRAMLQARIDRALGVRSALSLDTLAAELAGADALMGLLLRLEATLALPPEQAAAACSALVDEAESREQLAVGMRARLLRLQHRARGGLLQPQEADDVVARLRHCHPADTYLPEAWWTAAQAFDTLGQTGSADAVLCQGHDWVTRHALPQVPDEFRPSFLQRNPVNRDLLAAAARRLDLRAGATSLPITPPITPH